MNTIESINWYFSTTAEVEKIPHFTGVVQKINHELGKIATSIPIFDKLTTRPDTDRYKVKRDILLALGIRDSVSSSKSDDIDEMYQALSSDNDENKTVVINFGGQRRYGLLPRKYRRTGNCSSRQHRRSYDRDRGGSLEWNHKTFEQRCFNCGSPECRLSSCPT